MACVERSSTSARLNSLGASSLMLDPCRVGCVHQDDAPTSAPTGAEARNGLQAVAQSATATIAVAINLLFGSLAFCVRRSPCDAVFGVRGRVGNRLSRLLHRLSRRLRHVFRRVHSGL